MYNMREELDVLSVGWDWFRVCTGFLYGVFFFVDYFVANNFIVPFSG